MSEPYGLDALPVAPAQQTRNGLGSDLAKEVPQGNVDAGNSVGDGTAPALPKGGLMQLLSDPRRLDGLANQHGAQQRERPRH